MNENHTKIYGAGMICGKNSVEIPVYTAIAMPERAVEFQEKYGVFLDFDYDTHRDCVRVLNDKTEDTLFFLEYQRGWYSFHEDALYDMLEKCMEKYVVDEFEMKFKFAGDGGEPKVGTIGKIELKAEADKGNYGRIVKLERELASFYVYREIENGEKAWESMGLGKTKIRYKQVDVAKWELWRKKEK